MSESGTDRPGVRVAVVGVGNCASALVQGVHFYRGAEAGAFVPGLMHVEVGPYHVRDVRFVAAFDVAANKVGADLCDALKAEPNNTYRFADVPTAGVTVRRGPTMDGLGKYVRGVVQESDAEPVNVADELRRTGTEVLVSYLPVGSQKATEFYAEQALAAGCAFVNCVPAFIASNPAWAKRFADKKLPIVGDDVKSQVGATITHRVLANLFRDRGVRLDHTYQLNFGGNTDFMNMLERERLESKKISKTNAVTSQLDYELSNDDAHVGPSDHVPWLKDRKFCYIRPGGHDVRQRAAVVRAETGGVGFAQQRRRGDRRRAVREARARPRDRRAAGGAVELPDEDAAAAVHRQRGAGPHGGVHPGRGVRSRRRVACEPRAERALRAGDARRAIHVAGPKRSLRSRLTRRPAGMDRTGKGRPR